MKHTIDFLTAGVLSLAVAGAGSAAEVIRQKTAPGQSGLKVVWSISEGLQAPESVYHDADSGFLFLSQIGGGGGAARDGDGWISKLTVDGKVVQDKWVTGFNAPKGLRSHRGTLWVSDIDRVVAVDIAQGKIRQTIVIPGATFLNDLATGPDGAVYVSDMVNSRIIRIVDGQPEIFLQGEAIQHPNGLLVHDGHLIIGGWGTGFNDDFSTDTPGQLLKVNLKTGKQIAVTPEPTGNLDGIEADGRGGFLVTDWRAGKLFHVSGKGRVQVVQKFPRGLADHAYLVDRRLLILPEMMAGRLTAYRYGEPQNTR